MKKIITILLLIIALSNLQAQDDYKQCVSLSFGSWFQGGFPGIFYGHAIGKSLVAEISAGVALRANIDGFSNKIKGGSFPYLTGDETYNPGYYLTSAFKYYFNDEVFENFFAGIKADYKKYNLQNEFVLNSYTQDPTKFSSKNFILSVCGGYTIPNIESGISIGVRKINADFYSVKTNSAGLELLSAEHLNALRFNVLLDFRLAMPW